MTREEALSQCKSGDILIGNFNVPFYHMIQPIILIGECVECCTEKVDVIENVKEILVRSKNGFKTIWREKND